jgi:glyoxylase-like metal-dependent hydrolase (beta-lactamase superfamily II)
VSDLSNKRTRGRADRVLPAVWRLRLPLPWPGVPHVNAFAIEAGDGLVLFDTGIHEPGALNELSFALAQAGRRLEDVSLLVCTHAHSDHYGLAAPILEAAGCELWMHPRHEHMTRAASDPDRALERRIEVARQSGVPLEPLRRWAEERKGQAPGIAEVVMPHRELVSGVEVETDVGTWTAYETPGHAPSHVVLYEPEQRLLISGDHLLGRVSLYFDYGWTPDPVAEFSSSLDTVEALGARLCLPGHGRPFGDVPGHVAANRAELRERLERTEQAIAEEELTAFELVPKVFDQELDPMMASWMLTMMLCYVTHLEHMGRAARVTRSAEDGVERWRAPAPTVAQPSAQKESRA